MKNNTNLDNYRIIELDYNLRKNGVNEESLLKLGKDTVADIIVKVSNDRMIDVRNNFLYIVSKPIFNWKDSDFNNIIDCTNSYSKDEIDYLGIVHWQYGDREILQC